MVGGGSPIDILTGLLDHQKRLAAQYGAATLPDRCQHAEADSIQELFAVEVKMVSRRECDRHAGQDDQTSQALRNT